MSAARNGIGLVPLPEQCCIPAGWIVVRMKYCEFCGRSFVMRADSHGKVCKDCLYNPVFSELRAEKLLKAQEEYKEQFVGIKSSTRQLPRFDKSLTSAARKDSVH